MTWTGGEQDPSREGPAPGDEFNTFTGRVGDATVFCFFGREPLSPSSSELITTGSADVSPPTALSFPFCPVFTFPELLRFEQKRLGLISSQVDALGALPFDFFADGGLKKLEISAVLADLTPPLAFLGVARAIAGVYLLILLMICLPFHAVSR